MRDQNDRGAFHHLVPLFEPTQIQTQTPIFLNHLLEDLKGHHLDPLLMMKTKVRNLHQGHPHKSHLHQGHLHQRSNLRRVQTKTHYPSNLKVIDRYDSSSLSIKGPNPTGLTL